MNMGMPDHEIDFVITWVDGSDPNWILERQKYLPSKEEDASECRYRDFQLLRYWFRGVEKFAPWVRRIHLITCGHFPSWLDRENPKLNLVRHADYLPKEVLPSFNSNAIELSMHTIKGLARQFVYFNDDTFLLQPVSEKDFFVQGLPVDDAIISPVIPDSGDDGIGKTVLNNMYTINRRFDKKTVMSKYRAKFFSPAYGTELLRTMCLLPWHHFPGFYNDHLPVPYLRDTFETVWALEEEQLRATTSHRFRNCALDLSHWLMRYWQFCSGSFVPGRPTRGRNLNIEAESTLEAICSQKYKMICINDKIKTPEKFDVVKEAINSAFYTILPERSSFERD